MKKFITTILVLFATMIALTAKPAIKDYSASKSGNTAEFVKSVGYEEYKVDKDFVKEHNPKEIANLLKQGYIVAEWEDGTLFLISAYQNKIIYGQYVKELKTKAELQKEFIDGADNASK